MRVLLVFGVFAIMISALLIGLQLALAPRNAGPESVEITMKSVPMDVKSWNDPATGCDYILMAGGGITPRLDGVGRPMCRGIQQ